MKLTLFLSLGLVMAFAAQAHTQKQFKSVFEDQENNLLWSRALPGKYTNGCVDPEGRFDWLHCGREIGPDGRWRIGVNDSAAAKACAEFGGRLPTLFEYESLIRKFDHVIAGRRPNLTQLGEAQMQAIFGDMPKSFWTSSLLRSPYTRGDRAYYFIGKAVRQPLLQCDNEERLIHLSVRCVLAP